MSNGPEIPHLSSESSDSEDASQAQIDVFAESKHYLAKFESFLKELATTISAKNPDYNKILDENGNLKSVILKRNRFDFNDKGQIERITAPNMAETPIERDPYIEIVSPSRMMIVDDASPKVEYSVESDGTCDYTDDKMFITALRRFMDDALLKPITDRD